MKVLVCGDRNWTHKPTIEKVMKKYLSKEDTLIVGGAKGADWIAEAIGRDVIGCPVLVFMANWTKYGRAAGPVRNREMLKQGPDLVIAFHQNLEKSKGTADTVREARRQRIKVLLISEIIEDRPSAKYEREALDLRARALNKLK